MKEKLIKLKEEIKEIFGDNFDYEEIDNRIKEFQEEKEECDMSIRQFRHNNGEDYLYGYTQEQIITLKGKILEDEDFFLKNILNNKHMTDSEVSLIVNEFRKIRTKRFGF